jgi:hypothetical protein
MNTPRLSTRATAEKLDISVRTLKRIPFEELPFRYTAGGHRRYLEPVVEQYQRRRETATARRFGSNRGVYATRN